MGDDDKQKSGDPQPPATVKGMPDDIADFIDCKKDKVELKPGKQAWLGGIDLVGAALEHADISFTQNADGSITMKASMGDGIISTSIKLKVDGNGQLSIDPSDSTLLNEFKDKIDGWVNDFNNWLKSKGKKLGKPTVNDGKLTLTKEKTTAAAADPGKKDGIKQGLLPNVPIGEKIGAGALFAIACVGAYVGLPSDTTTVTTKSFVIPASLTEFTTTTVGKTTPPPTKVPMAITDGCLAFMHVPGQYSTELFFFTSYPQNAGDWSFHIANGPGGPEVGTGTLRPDGRGEASIRITQFGERSNLTVFGPGGVPASIGPFNSIVPFTVTPAPRTCDPEALKVPSAPSETHNPSNPSSPTQTPREQPTRTTQVVSREITTTDKGGGPWSLLLVPGAAAALGGALVLDDQRRQRKIT